MHFETLFFFAENDFFKPTHPTKVRKILHFFFLKPSLMEKIVDARNNLIDMNLIQPLKTDFFINLPLFSKYPATSINSYFYKMTLHFEGQKTIFNLFFVVQVLSYRNISVFTISFYVSFMETFSHITSTSPTQ